MRTCSPLDVDREQSVDGTPSGSLFQRAVVGSTLRASFAGAAAAADRTCLPTPTMAAPKITPDKTDKPAARATI